MPFPGLWSNMGKFLFTEKFVMYDLATLYDKFNNFGDQQVNNYRTSAYDRRWDVILPPWTKCPLIVPISPGYLDTLNPAENSRAYFSNRLSMYVVEIQKIAPEGDLFNEPLKYRIGLIFLH